jgi:hypothetical protein
MWWHTRSAYSPIFLFIHIFSLPYPLLSHCLHCVNPKNTYALSAPSYKPIIFFKKFFTIWSRNFYLCHVMLVNMVPSIGRYRKKTQKYCKYAAHVLYVHIKNINIKTIQTKQNEEMWSERHILNLIFSFLTHNLSLSIAYFLPVEEERL